MQLQYVLSMMKVLCEMLKLYPHASTVHAKILICCDYLSSSCTTKLSSRNMGMYACGSIPEYVPIKTSTKLCVRINRWSLCSIFESKLSPSSTWCPKILQFLAWGQNIPHYPMWNAKLLSNSMLSTQTFLGPTWGENTPSTQSLDVQAQSNQMWGIQAPPYSSSCIRIP